MFCVCSKRKRGYEEDGHIAKEPRLTEEVRQYFTCRQTKSTYFLKNPSEMNFFVAGMDGWRPDLRIEQSVKTIPMLSFEVS